jgi:hypothetical protein
MKDVVIVFAILLVLLLLISTFGGSIRYSFPKLPDMHMPGMSQQQQQQPQLPFAYPPMTVPVSETFKAEEESFEEKRDESFEEKRDESFADAEEFTQRSASNVGGIEGFFQDNYATI